MNGKFEKINCALTVNAVAVGKLFVSLNVIDIARACFVVMKLNALLGVTVMCGISE